MHNRRLYAIGQLDAQSDKRSICNCSTWGPKLTYLLAQHLRPTLCFWSCNVTRLRQGRPAAHRICLDARLPTPCRKTWRRRLISNWRGGRLCCMYAMTSSRRTGTRVANVLTTLDRESNVHVVNWGSYVAAVYVLSKAKDMLGSKTHLSQIGRTQEPLGWWSGS